MGIKEAMREIKKNFCWINFIRGILFAIAIVTFFCGLAIGALEKNPLGFFLWVATAISAGIIAGLNEV